MAIGSDNKFPKVIITEGSAPSSPSAGDQKVYIDSSDHKLKRKNSAGTVQSVDGDVAGPGSATDGHMAVFDGATGKLVKDGGAPSSGGASKVLIDTQTPSGVSTISFTSIPGTYKTLIIEFEIRGTAAQAYSQIDLIFNNDTTDANYRKTFHQAYGTNSESISGANDNSLLEGTGANSASGSFGVGSIRIQNYVSTAINKVAIMKMGSREATGSGSEMVYHRGTMEWESAAAITRADLTITSGGNYASGCEIRLYGEI